MSQIFNIYTFWLVDAIGKRDLNEAAQKLLADRAGRLESRARALGAQMDEVAEDLRALWGDLNEFYGVPEDHPMLVEIDRIINAIHDGEYNDQ